MKGSEKDRPPQAVRPYASAKPLPRVRQAVKGLLFALGFGRQENTGPVPEDTGTRLATERTNLAVERSYLAAERTLMAWIRTALSMISFGFTIGKLGQTVGSVEVRGVLQNTRMVSVVSIAYFLVILGSFALAGAILQYAVNVAEYADLGLTRRISISLLVAVIMTLLGGFALTALMMEL